MMKKNIILGISGGIAVYKSCDLVRSLVKKSFNVFVVMTKNAKEFVCPLTFKILSNNPVFIDMFQENSGSAMPHISLSEKCSIMVIAPATANIIAKASGGIADDLLSTLILSFSGKILIAPSMNSKMYNNPFFQENLFRLKKKKEKFIVLDPEEGDLACGEKGIGRMIHIQKILHAIENETK